MAWTSSTGPEGTFALADGANERGSLSTSTTGADRAKSNSSRPFAYSTLVHLCSLVAITPFAENDPILIVPAVIGVSISYLMLLRYPISQPNPAHVGAPRTVTNTECADAGLQLAVSNDNRVDADRPAAANLYVSTFPLVAVPLDSTELRSELRTELLARVSHELRTPLNAVMGFSDLMGQQMFGPLGHPRYEEYVTHIRESSQKLLKSAEDTLAMTSLMAKSASGCEREPLALGSLCLDAKTAIASDMVVRGIACIVDIEPGIEVIAHRRALRQALVNIICEAISQAAEGATLTIRASADLDRVALVIFADRLAARSAEENRSLPLCLARTLLELDGCKLYEDVAPNAPWSVLLSLDGAIQQELFATPHAI